MAGWFSQRLFPKRRYNPKDNLVYCIPQEIIDFTIRILREYGDQLPSSEGIVYWAGQLHKNEWHINCAVAPAVEASRYGFQTSQEANARFVEYICSLELMYICQVHSHPSEWVDHSTVDNQETAFRSYGLLSLVVPTFGKTGMLPLKRCGIHFFAKGTFHRLSDRYVSSRFKVLKEGSRPILLKDFRYEKLV